MMQPMQPIQLSRCSAMDVNGNCDAMDVNGNCDEMDVNDDIKVLLPRRLIFDTTSDDVDLQPLPLSLLCSETSDVVDLQPLTLLCSETPDVVDLQPLPLISALNRRDIWYALNEDATDEQHQQHWDRYLNRINQLYDIMDDDEPIPPPPPMVRQYNNQY